MNYERIKLLITGVSPLLMHNGQLADPMNEFAKAMKRVSGKRNKTEADFEEMARIEFMGGLYLSGGSPCIPGELVEAAFTEAARKQKRGPQAKAGVISDGMFPLAYDGPKGPDQLWADTGFRLTTGVKVQRARIMRTRPIFREWKAEIHIDYLPAMLNKSETIDIAKTMGAVVGLGDWRPKFGRFQTEVVQ